MFNALKKLWGDPQPLVLDVRQIDLAKTEQLFFVTTDRLTPEQVRCLKQQWGDFVKASGPHLDETKLLILERMDIWVKDSDSEKV